MMANELIYIVLIEDNAAIRRGWEMVLNNAENMKVIGSFVNCEQAFASPAIAEADIVLMDIGLPGMSGIEGVRYLKERYPQQIIVMCTVHEDDEKIFDALCAGAVGYLLKKTPPDKLADALWEAYQGGSPMTPTVARKVIASFQKKPIKTPTGETVSLSEREQQILERMAQGKSYAAIADEICLSVDGVYYHIRHIYEKLQVHSRAEAVAKGIKNRLIPPLK
ncbi:DNA-binding response regulator [candidate division KSB1 bacterium]|jgi:DNA-binding NarL/FixJ family response regulator|nr:MAG: DNA-binding response regulator [candidate division KSB1 bacterium]